MSKALGAGATAMDSHMFETMRNHVLLSRSVFVFFLAINERIQEVWISELVQDFELDFEVQSYAQQ